MCRSRAFACICMCAYVRISLSVCVCAKLNTIDIFNATHKVKAKTSQIDIAERAKEQNIHNKLRRTHMENIEYSIDYKWSDKTCWNNDNNSNQTEKKHDSKFLFFFVFLFFCFFFFSDSQFCSTVKWKVNLKVCW